MSKDIRSFCTAMKDWAILVDTSEIYEWLHKFTCLNILAILLKGTMKYNDNNIDADDNNNDKINNRNLSSTDFSNLAAHLLTQIIFNPISNDSISSEKSSMWLKDTYPITHCMLIKYFNCINLIPRTCS